MESAPWSRKESLGIKNDSRVLIKLIVQQNHRPWPQAPAFQEARQLMHDEIVSWGLNRERYLSSCQSNILCCAYAACLYGQGNEALLIAAATCQCSISVTLIDAYTVRWHGDGMPRAAGVSISISIVLSVHCRRG